MEAIQYKVGMLVTCSFREKEANVIRKVTDVQRLFNKKTMAYSDVVLCADGGSSGKPIIWVEERFFTVVNQIQYKGYTIEPSLSPFGGFDFFPTEEGRDDDYDLVGEDYKYCGNVRDASSLEEAKDKIDEIIMTSMPMHKVATQNGKNITKFWWISDAVKFAVRFNGDLFIGSPTSDHYLIQSI